MQIKQRQNEIFRSVQQRQDVNYFLTHTVCVQVLEVHVQHANNGRTALENGTTGIAEMLCFFNGLYRIYCSLLYILNICVCVSNNVVVKFQVITKIESNMRLMSVDRFYPVYKALTFLNNEVHVQYTCTYVCTHTQYIGLTRLYQICMFMSYLDMF